jgi:amino acid transporter
VNQLSKSLRFRDLVIIGLLFIGPAAAVGLFGVLDAVSNGAVGLVYIIATLVMAFTAWSYAQMSQAIPHAGAVYAYASAGINPQAGFLVGWIILLDYLFIPAVAYLFTGISLNSIFPDVPIWIWTLAAVIITSGLNLIGIKKSAKITFTVLIIEVIILFLVLGVGVYVLLTVPLERHWLSPFVGIGELSWNAIFAAVSIAVLSYLGFDAIATFAEENAGKKELIGRATLACLIIAGLLFVLQTYIGALLSPYSVDYLQAHPEIQGRVYYDMVNQSLGQWLGWLLALMKAASAAFAAMVGQAAAGRLIFSMARDHRLPNALAKIGSHSGVPKVALLSAAGVNMILAVIAANQADGLKHLVSFVDVGALSAFIMLHVSVIGYFIVKHRRRSAADLVKYLLLPTVGILALLPVLSHIQPLAKVIGAVWLLIGIIILFAHKDKAARPFEVDNRG